MPDWIICDCPNCGNTLRLDPKRVEEAYLCPACKSEVWPKDVLRPESAVEASPSPAEVSRTPVGDKFSRRWQAAPNAPTAKPATGLSATPGSQHEEEGHRPHSGTYKAWPGAGAGQEDSADLSRTEDGERPVKPVDFDRVKKVDWEPEEPIGLGEGFKEEFDEPEEGRAASGTSESSTGNGEAAPRKKQRKRRFGFGGEAPDWESSAPRKRGRDEATRNLIRAGYGIVALGAIIIGVYTFNTRARTHLAGDKPKSPALLMPGEQATPEREADAQLALREALVTRPKEVVASVRPTMEQFLKAPNWKERLVIVRYPERVGPLMEQYYASHPDGPLKFQHVGRDEMVSYRDNLLVLTAVMKDYSQKLIAAEYTGGRFLIDWESFVGYGEMEPAAMKSTRPAKPTLMRVTIARASPAYFNYAFTDEANLECYVVTFPDESYGFGYVEKSSKVQNQIREYLGENPSTKLTLNLRYPEGAVVGEQFWIDGVLANGWVLTNNPSQPNP